MIDAARPCDRCETPPSSLLPYRRCMWSERTVGAACDDGDWLTFDDVCSPSSQCQGKSKANVWQPTRVTSLPFQFIGGDIAHNTYRRVNLLDSVPTTNTTLPARVFVASSHTVPVRIRVLRGTVYVASFACAFNLTNDVDWCAHNDAVLLRGTSQLVGGDELLWSAVPLYIVSISSDVQFRLLSIDSTGYEVSLNLQLL